MSRGRRKEEGMRAGCLGSVVPATRRESEAADNWGDDLRGRERRTGSTRLDAIVGDFSMLFPFAQNRRLLLYEKA